MGSNTPVRVPIEVETTTPHHRATGLATYLRVVLNSCRVSPKDQSILLIHEAVDNEADIITVLKRRIAAAIGHDDARGVTVIGHNTDI